MLVLVRYLSLGAHRKLYENCPLFRNSRAFCPRENNSAIRACFLAKWWLNIDYSNLDVDNSPYLSISIFVKDSECLTHLTLRVTGLHLFLHHQQKFIEIHFTVSYRWYRTFHVIIWGPCD